MQLRHRVALDGIQLDEADERIMIQRVETGDAKISINTASLMGGSGSRVTTRHRDSIDITVKFTIRLKKRDMAEREEVLETVNAWAALGGWLTVNYKENRKIRVFLAQPAKAGDPWEWTQTYQLVFRACGVPFWQEESPVTLTKAGTDGCTLRLGVNGSEKSALGVQFLNTSGQTCDTFAIDTGESSMSLASLGLAAGETLVIDRDDNGMRSVLRIRIRGTGGAYRSAMAKRSTGSSDELTVSPGARTITMTAGKAGKLTVSCSGRFA